MSRSSRRTESVAASNSVVKEAEFPQGMSWRVGLGMTWFILFTAWFHSFGLPNNHPAARWMIWLKLPFDLMDLVDPPVIPNAAPWSWLYLGQRLPFLLEAVFIWLCAWGLGAFVLRGLRLREAFDSVERLFFSNCLGLAGVSLAMLGLGRVGLMSRWPLLVVLLLPLAAEFISRRREPRSEKGSSTFNPIERWSLLVAVPFVICMLLGAMSPQTDFDVIEYHLGGPKEWFQAGCITRLTHNVYTSFPFLTEMLLLCGMVLHGDWESGALAGQAVIAGFIPLTAIGLYATGRRWFSRSAGSLAALVWLTTPWAYRIVIISYAEGGLACYLFASLAVAFRIMWGETNDRDSVQQGGVHSSASPPIPEIGAEAINRRLAVLCGLLAGSAMACKYTGAVSVVLPVAAMILIKYAGSMRRPSDSAKGPTDSSRTGGTSLLSRSGFVELTLFSVGVLVAVGPWLLKNTIETGNPVFPLAYSVFGGEGRDEAMDAQWRKGHGAKSYATTTALLQDMVVKLTDVAANNDWHSALMFGLAPMALLAAWRRRVWCIWAFIGWQFLSWFLLTHHIDRFYVPMFPAVALLAGVASGWLFTLPRSRLKMTSCWLVVVMIAANVLFNAGIMMNLGGFNAGRTELSAAREMIKSPSQRWLDDERAAGRLPNEMKVLCVGEAALFHARFPYVYNTVFDRSLFEQWFFQKTGSGELALRPIADIRAALQQHGITHVLVNWSEILRYREPGSYGYTDVAHPDRFAELQAAGVFGDPLPLPPQAAFVSLNETRRKQIEAWAPGLVTTMEDKPVAISVQIFPVKR